MHPYTSLYAQISEAFGPGAGCCGLPPQMVHDLQVRLDAARPQEKLPSFLLRVPYYIGDPKRESSLI